MGAPGALARAVAMRRSFRLFRRAPLRRLCGRGHHDEVGVDLRPRVAPRFAIAEGVALARVEQRLALPRFAAPESRPPRPVLEYGRSLAAGELVQKFSDVNERPSAEDLPNGSKWVKIELPDFAVSHPCSDAGPIAFAFVKVAFENHAYPIPLSVAIDSWAIIMDSSSDELFLAL